MANTKSKVLVETSYSREINSLTLTEKDVQPQDNSFYIQVLVLLGGFIRVTTRIDGGEIYTTDMTKKEFQLLQDSTRETIDTENKAKLLTLGKSRITMLHSSKGEIGFGIGNKKYLIDETDVTLLREFCVKVM